MLQPARHSKLEKADILEMTVKHLENLQRQQAAMSAAADPSIINKFRAGFSECVSEVGRFQGLESTIKRRLIQHLANCLQINTNTILTTAPQPQQTQPKEQQNTPLLSAAQSTTVTVQQPSVQLHILPQQEPQNGIFFTNGNGTGVQLVPTRLPNGDIALILPTSITPAQPQRQQYAPQNRSTNTSPVSSASSSPLPMLIPIPAQQQQQRPYVIQSVQSSIPSPQDRPSSSTSSMSNASRLSPCRQSSPGYSMPGSPYEIMDTSITSSRKSPVRQPSPYQRPPPPQVQEQMPLSLVIRKAPPSPTYQHKLKQDMNEILNEKPWRPW